MSSIKTNRHALKRLMLIAEPRRRERAQGLCVQKISWNGQWWSGIVPGSHGDSYSARIYLAPQRAFSCTCVDTKMRGRDIGPCKHVIALAAAGDRLMNSFLGSDADSVA